MRRIPLLALLATLGACGDRGAPDAGLDAAADVDDALATDAPARTDVPADTAPPPPSRPAATPLRQWVDPRIGTGGTGFGVGSTFPGPQRPFGLARPGPDTSDPSGLAPFAHCAGYAYGDTLIEGFSQTRMEGTGISDYGAVGLMPTVGMSAAKTTQRGYRSTFAHDTESSSAGYYAVTLADTGVRAELTATDHASLYRFTFPAASDAVVLLDVGHTMSDVAITDGAVAIDPTAREVSGRVHFRGGYSGRFDGMDVYYVARFARPFARYGVWSAGVLAPGETSRAGAATGAFLGFDTASERGVQVAIGLSFTDVAHARANLDAEVPAAMDFDAARAAAEAQWESVLARVEVSARTEREFRMFYTALYHTLQMPTLASDADGTYRGIDQAVHHATGFRYYTDFSLWDTFRTLHPWLTLAYPEYQRDMLRSLVAMGADAGCVPRWPLGVGETGGMVGESAALVIADSYLKGVRDFDLRAAYTALRATAFASTAPGAICPGRTAVPEYSAQGWVPIEAGGASASSTLEYAYDDYALATLAGALGEAADRDALLARARNWRTLYDPTSRYLIGRNRDGSFPVFTDPTRWEGYYAEGDAWQYLWYVPHDLAGLADAMGGREALFARLDEFFRLSSRRRRNPLGDPYYWHGNEPDLHAAWIYAALDSPARSQQWVRWALATQYGDGPDGLPGNDDGGTMSAWYVFAALGLYPITAQEDYLLGSPTLTHAVLHLAGGDFVIDAPDASDAALYVTRATLRGAELPRARVAHSAIASGGTLSLEMGTTPSAFGAR